MRREVPLSGKDLPRYSQGSYVTELEVPFTIDMMSNDEPVLRSAMGLLKSIFRTLAFPANAKSGSMATAASTNNLFIYQ